MKRWRMEVIRSVTSDLSGGIRVSGTAAGGGGGGGELRRNSLLSSGLSSFQTGQKVFACLVLEVRAHVTGEGPVSVTLFCCAETADTLTHHHVAILDCFCYFFH